MGDSTFLADLEALSNVGDSFSDPLHIKDNDLDSIHNTIERYNDIMHKVDEALTNPNSDSDSDSVKYCNSLSLEIDKEISRIHTFLRSISNFPELESLVPHPIDYARVVKKIANATDLALVDLQGLLPPATIIAAVSLTPRRNPLALPRQQIDACDRAVALDEAKTRLLEFTETKMARIAPNLSAIVGAAVAAKLLPALQDTPPCSFRFLGSYLKQTEIIEATPPSLRKRACRLLAAKSALASRVDFAGSDPMGGAGKSMRDGIVKRIGEWQLAPPARVEKALEVAVAARRKRRGGVRARRAKERYGVTEMRKWANRMAFGVAEFGDGYGQGYGMLTGKLRVAVRPGWLEFKKKKSGAGAVAVAGATSSLSFTPLQGLQLSNPGRPVGAAAATTYFSQTAAFTKVNTFRSSIFNIK